MANNLTNTDISRYLGLTAADVTALQTAQGDEFQVVKNKFLTAILNKIAYQKVENMKWSTPFEELRGYPIKYGDTIENIFIDVPAGYDYDMHATNPFDTATNPMYTLYARLNMQKQYEITVWDNQVRQAVLNENGYRSLIDGIVQSLGTAKSLDYFNYVKCMLNNATLYENGFTATASTNKAITLQMANTIDEMIYPSKNNNKLGVMNASKKEDIRVYVKNTLKRNIDFGYLAGVFNLSKVDIGANIIGIDTFKYLDKNGQLAGDDLDFIIVDKNAFDIHDALASGSSIYNPKGMYTNYFNNYWGIISFKYYHNARAFKTTATTSH